MAGPLVVWTQQRTKNACPARESNINRPALSPASIGNYAAQETHTQSIINTFTNGRVLILLVTTPRSVQAHGRHFSQKVGVTSGTIGIATHALSSSLLYTVVTMRLRSAGRISGLQILQTSGNGHETQIQTADAIPCYWPKTTICVVLLTSHVWPTEHKTKQNDTQWRVTNYKERGRKHFQPTVAQWKSKLV